MLKKGLLLMLFTALTMFAMGLSSSVQAEGMTKAQGDAILKELQSIRTLLEKDRKLVAREKRAPSKVKISTKDGVGLGSKKAPLVLVEFTDYQCPYCQRFYNTTFAELKKKYIDTGKLRFISRNLPLPFHKDAENAALAAACAKDQGKYWQMRKSLFANPAELQAKFLSVYAKQNGMNVKRFDTCLAKKRHLKKIRKDVADARAIGITGTPSFVLARSGGAIVEGEKVVGAQPFAAFDANIQRLLKQKK